MATTAQWGAFAWGEAEWGSTDVGLPTPPAALMALAGAVPTLVLSNLDRTPPAGSLVFTGAAPAPGETRPLVGSLSLIGSAPSLEVSGENMLGVEWAVLHPADIPLAFQWMVLEQVISGAQLGLTWQVIAAAPILGFTWRVIPAEIFDLFDSDGQGAAAGIGEDILLPVGRVTRE